MGISGTLVSKIGLPVAIIAVAGILLFRFKDPIIKAVSGGASTLGTTLSAPFGSFLSGINEGLKTIPKNIDIVFPTFKFKLGDGEGTGKIGNDDATRDQNLCDNTLGILCFNGTKAGAGGMGGKGGDGAVTKPPPDKMQDAPMPSKNKLTPISGTRVISTMHGNSFSRMSVENIIGQNPDVIGLFDDINTRQTEFFPLSREAVGILGKSNLKLSGQLFKEIKGINDIV